MYPQKAGGGSWKAEGPVQRGGVPVCSLPGEQAGPAGSPGQGKTHGPRPLRVEGRGDVLLAFSSRNCLPQGMWWRSQPAHLRNSSLRPGQETVTFLSAVEMVPASILTCRARRAQAVSSFFRSKSEFHSSELPLNLLPPAQASLSWPAATSATLAIHQALLRGSCAHHRGGPQCKDLLLPPPFPGLIWFSLVWIWSSSDLSAILRMHKTTEDCGSSVHNLP